MEAISCIVQVYTLNTRFICVLSLILKLDIAKCMLNMHKTKRSQKSKGTINFLVRNHPRKPGNVNQIVIASYHFSCVNLSTKITNFLNVEKLKTSFVWSKVPECNK